MFEETSQKDLDRSSAIGYTIGGMMLWPGDRVDGKMTMNQARGFHPRIKDRFDLTVECVLRYYSGRVSPLSETLQRYREFFGLFKDFQGFVEFFLLQDIVASDFGSVRFFAPFDDFQSSPLPQSATEYASYMAHAIEFIEARNRRIEQYSP